jgi:hypothetical protein
MKDIMVDLETFSSKSNAAIASVGAVQFDINTGELGATFYANINLKAQNGIRRFSGETIYWWLSQPKEAAEALSKPPVLDPKTFCENFHMFYHSVGGKTLWSHATFDAVVLRSFYDDFGTSKDINRYGCAPWHYRDARDIRTLNAIAHSLGYHTAPTEGSTDRVVRDDLIPHHALGDAKRQAIYVSEMWKFIKENK